MELNDMLERLERRIMIACAAMDGVLLISGDFPTYNGAYYAVEEVREAFGELQEKLQPQTDNRLSA